MRISDWSSDVCSSDLLSDKQIAFTIAHAGSRILFFEPNLAELVARLRPLLPGIERYVLLAERGTIAPDVADTLNYEALLASEDGALTWMSFDEKAAAFLCYTSGTTGDPKGVLYSHRSIVLHGMAAGLSSAFWFSAFDVILPCSFMSHAPAWGLPFTAAING